MYDAYSRAEPARRTLALARVIPIRPSPVTIVRIVAVMISSIVENPRSLRGVFLLALLIFICVRMVQPRILWSRWSDHVGPLSNRGATEVLPSKLHIVRSRRWVELTELQSDWFEFGYEESQIEGVRHGSVIGFGPVSRKNKSGRGACPRCYLDWTSGGKPLFLTCSFY